MQRKGQLSWRKVCNRAVSPMNVKIDRMSELVDETKIGRCGNVKEKEHVINQYAHEGASHRQ